MDHTSRRRKSILTCLGVEFAASTRSSSRITCDHCSLWKKTWQLICSKFLWQMFSASCFCNRSTGCPYKLEWRWPYWRLKTKNQLCPQPALIDPNCPKREDVRSFSVFPLGQVKNQSKAYARRHLISYIIKTTPNHLQLPGWGEGCWCLEKGKPETDRQSTLRWWSWWDARLILWAHLGA